MSRFPLATRRRAVIALTTTLVAAACSTPTGGETAVSPSAAIDPGIVGTWERATTCEELVSALIDAGLEQWVAEGVAGNGFVPGVTSPDQIADPADPCAGAVPRTHSHFFTEGGLFGSLDWNGEQVDDGTYELVDGDTLVVSKEFPDVTFRFTIDGETLSLEPVIPGCSPSCFEAAWSVSVAYPGKTWLRVGDEIRGCVPECSTGFADPGAIGPGPYTTAGFLDGQLTVRYPTAWESHEDQGVEFSSAPQGEFDVHRVLFWNDILPWTANARNPNGRQVPGVPNTTAGWLAWLSSHPDFVVSAPRTATIGHMRLPATYVDIAVEPGTIGFDEGAVVLLSWPNADGHFYSFGGSFVLRLYLSDVTYGGTNHLLAVAIEGQDRADLKAFAREAGPVIASADAPIQPA